MICIVETVADLWALERSKVYNGKYHILGGVLSAIDGINPEQLNIASLEKRLEWSSIAKNGRFKLYPTGNMYNFIMVDVIDGRTWQVQWNTDKFKRIVDRFYN